MLHSEVNTDGTNAKQTKNERYEYPYRSVFQKLFPVSSLHGETGTHTGDHKEYGDTPNIDHPHKDPQPFQRLFVLYEENVMRPRLEAHHHMVHN